MRVAYLDCVSGISGDMMLGALVDAGVPLDQIQQGIDTLGLPSCRLDAREVTKKGFRATHITVLHEPEHRHRHLGHITGMIDGSQLSPAQKELATRIFVRLAEAEARVHGTTIEKVHFHEVGAVDSIADIVGSAIGWDLLGVSRIHCSPIPTGQGFVKIAHGRVSVPAPATAELLKGIPIAPSNVDAELTTPTGAAIAAALVNEFGGLPFFRPDAIGYGAGTRDLADQPNVLRLFVGEQDGSLPEDTVWVLETNLDDVPGEWIGYCTQQLLGAGALDVYAIPIQMKKDRPGIILGVLCQSVHVSELERIIFSETGSLGIRRWQAARHTLRRRAHRVDTPWGPVEGKLAQLNDRTSFSPEYESCRHLAQATGRPLREIYRAAQRAFDLSEDAP